jgi:hypothetical protein
MFPDHDNTTTISLQATNRFPQLLLKLKHTPLCLPGLPHASQIGILSILMNVADKQEKTGLK